MLIFAAENIFKKTKWQLTEHLQCLNLMQSKTVTWVKSLI